MVGIRALYRRLAALESGEPAGPTWNDPEVKVLRARYSEKHDQAMQRICAILRTASENRNEDPSRADAVHRDQKQAFQDAKRATQKYLRELKRIAPRLHADYLEWEERDRPHRERFINEAARAIELAANEDAEDWEEYVEADE